MAMVFLIAAGAFAYSAHRGHLIGEIASVVMLPCALHGVWRGGFRKSTMLAVAIGTAYLLSAKSDFAAPLITAVGGPAGSVGNIVAAGAIAMVAWITMFFIARSIHRRVIAKNRFFGAVDRFAGTLVGAAEGALVVLTVCWCASSLRPYATDLVHANETVAGSARDRIGKYMLQIAAEADDGTLGQITKATNPIGQFPALQDAIDQLNTTGTLNIESIDPATLQGVQSLLDQSGASNTIGLDSMLEKVKENNAANEAAYKQLPSSNNRR